MQRGRPGGRGTSVTNHCRIDGDQGERPTRARARRGAGSRAAAGRGRSRASGAGRPRRPRCARRAPAAARRSRAAGRGRRSDSGRSRAAGTRTPARGSRCAYAAASRRPRGMRPVTRLANQPRNAMTNITPPNEAPPPLLARPRAPRAGRRTGAAAEDGARAASAGTASRSRKSVRQRDWRLGLRRQPRRRPGRRPARR